MKNVCPPEVLMRSSLFGSPIRSLKSALQGEGSSRVVAEFKRSSPSENDIFPDAPIIPITTGYQKAGACGLSILTSSHFGGSISDLLVARSFCSCPLLRKDFIIDAYQLVESRAMGADAVLLIRRILEPEKILELCEASHELGLEVLLELHEGDPLEPELLGSADLVGINNRDLDTFQVDTQASMRMIRRIRRIPGDVLAISESGIGQFSVAANLLDCGYGGLLVGTTFMREPDPPLALERYLEGLRRLGSPHRTSDP